MPLCKRTKDTHERGDPINPKDLYDQMIIKLHDQFDPITFHSRVMSTHSYEAILSQLHVHEGIKWSEIDKERRVYTKRSSLKQGILLL